MKRDRPVIGVRAASLSPQHFIFASPLGSCTKRINVHIRKGTSTGRTCDGYDRQYRSKLLPQITALDLFRVRTNLGNTTQESQYLQFFMERTVMQLQTFFPDELWNNCLPQVAYSESSIRHALVAFSLYHERYMQNRNDDATFALTQYNLAIKELTKDRGSPKPQIQLMSCLIFICIHVSSAFFNKTWCPLLYSNQHVTDSARRISVCNCTI